MSLADTIAARVSAKYAADGGEDTTDEPRAALLKCSRAAIAAVKAGDEGAFLDAMLRMHDEREVADDADDAG